MHLPVATGAPLGSVVALRARRGLRVLAADGAGDRDLDDRPTPGPSPPPPRGSSATRPGACREADRALADDVVRVPIHGRAESLNLATAAAVCLYASARAHR